MRCPAASTNVPPICRSEGRLTHHGWCMSGYRQVRRLSDVDAAYVAGLIDGEGTITLSRRHARDQRQPVVSIANTERCLLEFVLTITGAGKITRKRVARPSHTPSFCFSICNRQALALLHQVAPYLRGYKRARASLLINDYVRLTPRNGKYSAQLLEERRRFEEHFLRLRANAASANDLLASTEFDDIHVT